MTTKQILKAYPSYLELGRITSRLQELRYFADFILEHEEMPISLDLLSAMGTGCSSSNRKSVPVPRFPKGGEAGQPERLPEIIHLANKLADAIESAQSPRRHLKASISIKTALQILALLQRDLEDQQTAIALDIENLLTQRHGNSNNTEDLH